MRSASPKIGHRMHGVPDVIREGKPNFSTMKYDATHLVRTDAVVGDKRVFEYAPFVVK